MNFRDWRRGWAYWKARFRLAWLAFTDQEVARAWTSRSDLNWIGQAPNRAENLLERAARRYAPRLCLATPQARVTYAELWARVEDLCQKLELKPGQTMLLCGPPDINWVVADLACLCRGGVSVPLADNLRADDRQFILNQVQPACTFSQGQLLQGPDYAPSHSSEIFSVVYTSGSTGRPKGVILTQARWADTLRDALKMSRVPRLTASYLPLHHMAGRINLYKNFMVGGVTTLVNQEHLLEWLPSIRPTNMVLVPRISGLLYQEFQRRLLERGGFLGTVSQMMRQPEARQIARSMRQGMLGGRLCFVHVGAAPTPEPVRQFLEQALDLHVTDLYGSTELGPISVNGRIYPWLQYKLIDRAELGFRLSDTPHPRGELAIKSPRQTPGYFADPEASRQLVDSQGFVATGDMVEEVRPGQIRWLDRGHQVSRLAQGQFVHLSGLEELYAGSPYIQQCYLYANPEKEYLVGVVVPSHKHVTAAEIRQEMTRIASQNGLASYQIPRDFLLEPEAFSSANGLLSEAQKPLRTRLKERYGRELEELYQKLDSARFTGSRSHDPVLSTITRCLGVSPISPQDTFIGLGGDSLAAVQVCHILKQDHQIEVAVSRLLDPQVRLADLRSLPHRIDLEPTRLSAAYLLGVSDLKPRPQPRVPGGVLLTGANGLLGRAMLLELLRSEVEPLFCLVRAPDAVAARFRLLQSFRDPAAREQVQSRVERLVILAGDLSSPQLGLTGMEWERLLAQVDCILHLGAEVDHLRSYPQLFPSNVKGTGEVSRLLLSGCPKSMHFASTVALRGDPAAPPSLSEADFAAGYLASKWAAECFLRDLYRHSRVPINLVRVPQLLPHREFPAELNPADGWIRLLWGLYQVRLAPASLKLPLRALPVDQVAQFMVRQVLAPQSGLRTLTVAEDTAASWDWLIDRACRTWKLQRLPQEEFFPVFREALQGLPPELQQKSPLALLARWERQAPGNLHPSIPTSPLDPRTVDAWLRAVEDL